GPERDVVGRCEEVDEALVDDAAVGMQEVQRDGGPAAVPRRGTVDARRRGSVGVPQALQGLEEPGPERLDPPGDRVDADPLEMAQADLDGRDAAVVDGAVLVARV